MADPDKYEYECELCGDLLPEDELIGLTQVNSRWVVDEVRDCDTAICHACRAQVAAIHQAAEDSS